MNPSISVVTLTHNKVEYTRRCLGSLLDTASRAWELVVVDNGSTDGTRDWLNELSSSASRAGVSVNVVLNPGNIGCSTARNQGLEAAKGHFVCFVDNDIALRSKRWLDRLARVLDADRTVGLVAPKLVYPYPPYAIQCAGAAVSGTGRVQFMGRGEPRDDPRFNRTREVQCLISACFMGRRDVLEGAGGFDEAFNPVEYEDIDLSYKIREAGYRLLYEPSVEMYHFESVTTAGTASLPNTYLIIKHGMLFKRRWRHRFENEHGPGDEDTRWLDIPPRPLSSIQALPLTD